MCILSFAFVFSMNGSLFWSRRLAGLKWEIVLTELLHVQQRTDFDVAREYREKYLKNSRKYGIRRHLRCECG